MHMFVLSCCLCFFVRHERNNTRTPPGAGHNKQSCSFACAEAAFYISLESVRYACVSTPQVCQHLPVRHGDNRWSMYRDPMYFGSSLNMCSLHTNFGQGVLPSSRVNNRRRKHRTRGGCLPLGRGILLCDHGSELLRSRNVVSTEDQPALICCEALRTQQEKISCMQIKERHPHALHVASRGSTI